ncbi:DctP family TRAP transporter solute-binding subunit [candidate division KSB3 bacterium]|uniref:DctP family TRAP transporter solute-binding subunit n=1 Tax=candidate division KSB3 bacterium TaxID=2044937 RepID=A0A9D5JSY2_9BACT|nr:DctP family TRAP transporter solute-binding subunit [candidate division KSB3 bacterium]MBD3323407.1 DctP family TRAP transporter solute-binding subunit [candidate division KSB3 bacterium]
MSCMNYDLIEEEHHVKALRIVLIVSVVLSVGLVGSAFAQLDPTPEDPVILRIGTLDKEDDLAVGLEYTMCKVFEAMVETNTGGAIQVEVFHSGSLGKMMAQIEAVQAGEQEALTGTAGIPSFYPEWQVFSIPYLFDNSEIAMSVMNHSAFMRDLYENMRQKTGLRVLGVAQNGFRHFTNSKRPIHTPADLEGLKFRVMQGPIYQKVVEAVGGNATPIAWSELYTSLKTGIVDGQENPISAVKLGSLDEVQKYITLDGHIWSENYLIINDEFFNSLPEKFQVVVQEAGSQAALAGTASEHIASYIVGVDYCLNHGMEIYKPTPDELAMFREKAQGPVVEWLKGEIGEEIVNGMLETVEETKAKLGY